MIGLLKRAIRHPVWAIRHLPSWLDSILEPPEYRRVSNRGERLVVKSWELARTSADPSTLAHIQRYEWALSLVKHSEVLLDDGCGTGYGASYLATYGVERVVGIDNSEDAISFARRHYQAGNLVFEVMDACDLRFSSGVFDALVSFDVWEHIPFEFKEKFVSEIARVLKPSGILCVGCPNGKASSLDNPFHYDLSKEEFGKLLSRHFGNIRLLGQALVVNGVRQGRCWYNHLPAKLTLGDLEIVGGSSDLMFGLLAICKKPVDA